MNGAAAAHAAPGFDVAAVRRRFPVLARTIHGHPLVYLDNGASSQRPTAVIDAVNDDGSHQSRGAKLRKAAVRAGR